MNELTIRYQFIVNRIENLITSNEEAQIAQRWERRPYKKNKINIKYKIFLLRTSLQPDVTRINKLKRSLILLEEENRESFSKYCNLYNLNF